MTRKIAGLFFCSELCTAIRRQTIPPFGGYMQNLLSRVWFLNQGCKQVPLEHSRGIVRWGHPDGYFLNAQGQKEGINMSPSSLRAAKDPNRKKGKSYPIFNDRKHGAYCHIHMALAFYGDRPTYIDPKTGKEYVGIVHHLIPDPLDYKPDNLLCWLTREEHNEADRRQRALRKVLPDMHAISYDEHRRLQDPRTMSCEAFELELQKLRDHASK